MKKQRKSYTAAFKAKVALEAIKGQRTTNEIASAYEVHPNQVTQWKKQAVSQLSEIFSNGRARAGAIRSASQFRQGCEGSDPAVFAAAADFAGQIDQKSINKHGSP